MGSFSYNKIYICDVHVTTFSSTCNNLTIQGILVFALTDNTKSIFWGQTSIFRMYTYLSFDMRQTYLLRTSFFFCTTLRTCMTCRVETMIFEMCTFRPSKWQIPWPHSTKLKKWRNINSINRYGCNIQNNF